MKKKSVYIVLAIFFAVLILILLLTFKGKLTGTTVNRMTGDSVSQVKNKEVCYNIDNDNNGLIDDDLIRPCGCKCSPPSRVLMVLDDNNHGEDVNDFDIVYSDLIALGANVTRINEPKNGLSYNDIKNYELVWFSNPGWPIDDEATLDALQQHINNGHSVVFQGDDMTWTMDNKFDKKLENFTGLKNINNGLDTNYDVFFSDREHPLLNLLGGEWILYNNDDIDTSIVTGNNVGVLAWAWCQKERDKYNGPAVVVRDYTEQGRGVLLVALMTFSEIEPEAKRKTFVSNIINWMLIRTNSCDCPEGPCGPGYEQCVNGSWSSCILAQPQKEVCDGLDNNCNGLVDEDLVSCCSIGNCTGLKQCRNGVWQNCTTNEGVACKEQNISYVKELD